jgi:hypothetical protein
LERLQPILKLALRGLLHTAGFFREQKRLVLEGVRGIQREETEASW